MTGGALGEKVTRRSGARPTAKPDHEYQSALSGSQAPCSSPSACYLLCELHQTPPHPTDRPRTRLAPPFAPPTSLAPPSPRPPACPAMSDKLVVVSTHAFLPPLSDGPSPATLVVINGKISAVHREIKPASDFSALEEGAYLDLGDKWLLPGVTNTARPDLWTSDS